MDPAKITEDFANFYYASLSADRSQLASIYKADSTISREDGQFQGTGPILEKIKAFPEGVQFKVTTKDFQICGDKLIVLVTGQLLITPDAQPLHFSQAFCLSGDGAGGFYVLNDLFRLNYG